MASTYAPPGFARGGVFFCWQNKVIVLFPGNAKKDGAMLELRPNCEWCDRDLPPADTSARICSYECTYCAECVETVLHNVCPTCGGGFVPRPIRPVRAEGNQTNLGLANRPASTVRHASEWSRAQVDAVSRKLRTVPPAER